VYFTGPTFAPQRLDVEGGTLPDLTAPLLLHFRGHPSVLHDLNTEHLTHADLLLGEGWHRWRWQRFARQTGPVLQHLSLFDIDVEDVFRSGFYPNLQQLTIHSNAESPADWDPSLFSVTPLHTLTMPLWIWERSREDTAHAFPTVQVLHLHHSECGDSYAWMTECCHVLLFRKKHVPWKNVATLEWEGCIDESMRHLPFKDLFPSLTLIRQRCSPNEPWADTLVTDLPLSPVCSWHRA